MIKPHIINEYASLKKVVLGIANDFGGCPSIEEAYDPKTKQHILNKTFPLESDLKQDLLNFQGILEKYNVNVLKPVNMFSCNQIFVRDVGFVIDNTFFISNMIEKRSREILGFDLILKQINTNHICKLPPHILAEGGDVVVAENHLFIGYSESADFSTYEVARTNKEAISFFSHFFPSKKVIPFELQKSDNNPYKNCLHLDCCFQPLGLGHALVFPGGFKNKQDVSLIESIFGKKNLIIINEDEMYNMFSNLFSISSNVIVTDKKFDRVNTLLAQKGYIIEATSFSEVSKMGGLFRCSTLPLER